jgi:hypothetical protein
LTTISSNFSWSNSSREPPASKTRKGMALTYRVAARIREGRELTNERTNDGEILAAKEHGETPADTVVKAKLLQDECDE